MPSTPEPKAQVPSRIAKNVRVNTRGKNLRYGTIIEATGKHVWNIRFDDGSTGVFKSQQLQIYEEYYNKPSETPMQKAASTIKRILRKTVSKKCTTRNNLSISSSSSESQSAEDSSTSSSRVSKDGDFSLGQISIQDEVHDGEVEVLLTPRTLSPSPRQSTRPRTLFEEESDVLSSDGSRRSNHSFDDNEENEEDGVRLPTVNFEDGGEDQCDFVDVPQKADDFMKATRLMNEKKKELMGTTITKTTKPTNKYAPGGLVEGAPKTIKEGKKGTIIDEPNDGFYLIEWDDADLPDCVVEKKHLRLQKGLSETYVWKFVENHFADNPPTEYKKHGLINFSSKGFDKDVINNTKSDMYDHPFAKLVDQLWPGDWRDQLSKLNKHIQTECKGVKQVGTDEWWNFWGIMIFAAGAGVGGEDKLWDKKDGLFEGFNRPNRIDLSDIMLLYRFKQIKKLIPKAFVGKDQEDPWNPIMAMIDGFNNSRAQDIAASFAKVFDESMSAWKTRTTQLGGLPFLSFILRKPKPLGTEGKVAADTETGKYGS